MKMRYRVAAVALSRRMAHRWQIGVARIILRSHAECNQKSGKNSNVKSTMHINQSETNETSSPRSKK